jgi:uncharacterized membrane protein YkoI
MTPTTRPTSRLLAAALALVAVVALATSPLAQQAAQVAADAPIRGTIQVADDAEDPALARVTADQARDAALAAVPGATFLDADLDEEDGFLVYDVDLTTATEEVDVTVDAGNAAILEVEREALDED